MVELMAFDLPENMAACITPKTNREGVAIALVLPRIADQNPTRVVPSTQSLQHARLAFPKFDEKPIQSRYGCLAS